MIDYSPLFRTLNDKELQIKDLYQVIGHDTASKFKKNESVRLDIIDRICILLDVPIEKVVRIVSDDE